jgi:hypothetical protein
MLLLPPPLLTSQVEAKTPHTKPTAVLTADVFQATAPTTPQNRAGNAIVPTLLEEGIESAIVSSKSPASISACAAFVENTMLPKVQRELNELLTTLHGNLLRYNPHMDSMVEYKPTQLLGGREQASKAQTDLLDVISLFKNTSPARSEEAKTHSARFKKYRPLSLRFYGNKVMKPEDKLQFCQEALSLKPFEQLMLGTAKLMREQRAKGITPEQNFALGAKILQLKNLPETFFEQYPNSTPIAGGETTTAYETYQRLFNHLDQPDELFRR